jgi:hypothetical protein
MEHPFLVDEFTPAHAPQLGFAPANHLVTPEPQSPAALPPLPNLSASEVLFLTPSVAGDILMKDFRSHGTS